MLYKLSRYSISIILSVLIFTVLIKLNYSYETTSFGSIFVGLAIGFLTLKKSFFLDKKLLVILIVSTLSIPIQKIFLHIFGFQLRYAQITTVLFCYVVCFFLNKNIVFLHFLIAKIFRLGVKCNKIIISNSSNINSCLMKSIWMISVAMVLFIVFYMIPHRGFDYTDTGYVLYDNINLINGVIPGPGYAGILNIPLYLIGLNYYLAYEIYYCIIAIISILLIFYAFDKHKSVMLPVTIVLVITCIPIYILSYQQAPQFLLIIAIALLLVGNEKGGYIVTFIAVVTLSLSSFSNIALLPALASNFFALFFIKKHKNIFIASYILFSIMLAYLYFNSSLNIFFHGGHTVEDKSFILSQCYSLFNLIVSENGFIYLLLVSVVYRVFAHKRKIKSYISLYIFILLSSVVVYLQWSNTTQMKWSYDNYIPVSYFRLIEYQIFILSLILLFKNNFESYLKVFIGFLVTVFIVGLCVTSTTEPVFHLSFVAAGYISIAVLISLSYVDTLEDKYRSIAKTFVCLLFFSLACLSFVIQINSNYNSNQMSENSYYIDKGYLTGVFSSVNKANSYNDILEFYGQAACKGKTFVAIPALPLVYDIFDRRAFGDQAWVSPIVGNEVTIEKVTEYIKKQKHWCVIVAPEYWDSIFSQNYTQELTAFLSKESICKEKFYDEDGVGNTPKRLVFCSK
ncbi:hypothetical protein F7308_0855 [Francisella salina]|uniref:Glycosyltransferase RgtA/B/C/D-like domain-containing protein n=2 Tax=Francisella salina TaxID=573569 RepID=A0ABM5M977_FRAST|nr:hypothetical protein F7308_0855 [Francisella salina]